jgi:hypothetical protein
VVASLFGIATLHALPDFHDKLRKALGRHHFSEIDRTKHFRDRSANLGHDIFATTVKQPPTEGQIPAVGLEVGAIGILKVVVIVILEGDTRILPRWRSERNNAGEVIATAKKVELNAGEKGQKREGIDEGKCTSNRWTGRQ